MRSRKLALLLAALVGGPWAGAAAQEPGPDAVRDSAADGAVARSQETLRVFVDCDGRLCDLDFFRREVPFVDYVRDRRDAQVHLLITSQRTGAGGRSFTLDFLGREEFQGLEDRLQVSSRPEQPEEEVLEALSRAIELGLARYIARTPDAARARLVVRGRRKPGMSRRRPVRMPGTSGCSG